MVIVQVFAFLLLWYLPHGAVSLLCPALVKSFSNDAFNNSYYTCSHEGAVPKLQLCPPSHVYWPSKERCELGDLQSRNVKGYSGKSDLRMYTTPVLGRTVYLGSLFNARSNEIMAGDSFWKRKTIEENKDTSPSSSSDLYFYAAQSTFDRFSHMDFDAAIKLEFLGGLIKVEGSASYLKDSVESENTVAIVMKAHYVTRADTLPSTTPLEFERLCKLDGPTHVVTSLTFGMDAHFVFTKKVSSTESKEKVAGMLKIAVESIPTISIEGEAHAHIEGTMKETVKNVKAKIDGDFVLERQPTTFNESLVVFKDMPKYLGEKPEYKNAAKMNMQLTPITRFCDETSAILVSISDNLIQSVTIMLDKLERTNLKAKTLAMSDCVNSYIALKRIMDTFLVELNKFQLEIKGQLQTLLPKIRSGGAGGGEKELVQLLTHYTTSPFNYDTANSFLKTRNREIEMIDFILNPKKYEGTRIKVLDYARASDDKVLFEKHLVVMLKFHILPSVDVVRKFLDGKIVDESESWFNQNEIIATMGDKFREFIRFAASNENSNDRGFLISMHEANKTYLNLCAVKKGKIITTTFHCPQQPPKLSSVSTTHDTISFDIKKPENEWVTHFDVKYTQFGRTNTTIVKQFAFRSQNTTLCEINGLFPNEQFTFSMRYVTEMGSSSYSTESSLISTRASSVPSGLKLTWRCPTCFSIEWNSPLHVGVGLQIELYEVTILQGTEVVNRTRIMGQRRSTVFTGLNYATWYNVTISAIANTKKVNKTKEGTDRKPKISLPAWLRLVTRPDTPSQPNLVDVSYHSAKINWQPPTRFAEETVVEDYIVEYVKTNNFGNVTMIGSNLVQSSRNNTYISIKSLVQGTSYQLKVKIITSLGNSEYSPALIIKTLYKKTELDALRGSIEEEIKNRVLSIKTDVQRVKSSVDSIFNTSSLDVHYYTPDCGGSLNVVNTTTILKYPLSGMYGRNKDCHWYVDTAIRTTVQFASMDLEDSPHYYDYVKVFDDGSEVLKLMGHQTASHTSSSGKLHLHFHSDGSNEYSGFTVRITAPTNHACGGELDVDSELRYPLSGEYPPNADCHWYVNGGIGTNVTFTKMDVRDGGSDYVDVYDDDIFVNKYQYSRTGSYISKFGNLHLHFHSDYSNQYNGFVAEISGTDEQARAAKRYYYDSKAKYINNGSPISQTDLHSTAMSQRSSTVVTDCIKICHERYLKDSAWNQVVFESDPGFQQEYMYKCICYKGGHGLQKHGNKLLYTIG